MVSKSILLGGLCAMSLASAGPLRPIDPPGAVIPGVSQAILAEPGRTLYLSGQVPLDGAGQLVPGGLEAQLVQAFDNLHATLRAAGGETRDLARITLYVRDYQPQQLALIRRVRDRYVDSRLPPASALIGVASLFHPEVLVEVDAIAVLPLATEARP